MYDDSNLEYSWAIVDSNKYFLAGIRKDNGQFVFGGGCPEQIKDYFQSVLGKDLDSINLFLNGLLGGTNLSTLLSNKVDKEENKGLIDSTFAGKTYYIEHPEYNKAVIDADGYLISAIRKDGIIYPSSLNDSKEDITEIKEDVTDLTERVEDAEEEVQGFQTQLDGKESAVTTVYVLVDRNGSNPSNNLNDISGTEYDCNYAGLNGIKQALDAITDSSYYKRYHVFVNGHFVYDNDVSYHTKCMNSENAENTWWVNAYGKNYVTLDGVDYRKTSIELYLGDDTDYPRWSNNESVYYGSNYHVLFNNANWFECKNMTLIGKNCRYNIHMDSMSDVTKNKYCLFESCHFVYYYDALYTGRTYHCDTMLGCGYKINLNTYYKNCIFDQFADANIIGAHGDFNRAYINYLVQENNNVYFDSCQFNSVGSLFSFEVFCKLPDYFHFNNCTAKETNDVEYFTAGSPGYYYGLPRIKFCFPSLPTNVITTRFKSLKFAVNSGNASVIRIDENSTAYSIISEQTIFEEQEKRLNEWGAYEQYGQIFKDDNNGLNGYNIGTRCIYQSGQSYLLGSILGDCSVTLKTLKLYVNGIEKTYTFNQDYTNTTFETIIANMNAQVPEVTVSLYCLDNFVYPIYDGVYLYKNNGSSFAEKGVGVSCTNKEFTIASSSDVVDGILIDDTPIGEWGRVASKGTFYVLSDSKVFGAKVTGTIAKGKKYAIGSTDGVFEEVSSGDYSLIALSDEIVKIKKY